MNRAKLAEKWQCWFFSLFSHFRLGRAEAACGEMGMKQSGLRSLTKKLYSYLGGRFELQEYPGHFPMLERRDGLPSGASGKETTCQSRKHKRWGFNPGLRRSMRRGRGNPLQRSCLENPMSRGAWWSVAQGDIKSQTWLKRLGTHTELERCKLY